MEVKIEIKKSMSMTEKRHALYKACQEVQRLASLIEAEDVVEQYSNVVDQYKPSRVLANIEIKDS